MLSPNLVEISEDIVAANSQFRAVTIFGNAAGRIVVSPLSPDPDWLPPLRHRISELAKICTQWRIDYPDNVVNYFLPFTRYATTFGAFSKQVKQFGNDIALWNDALNALHSSILAGQSQARDAAKAFRDHLRMIKIVEGQLNTSLSTAWAELSEEESKMVAIATQITRLQDRVDQLQENLTSHEISSGKSYFQTAVKISYTIMTAATVEIPYLAVVTEIYTIGKMAYDLIVTDKEIGEALQQIADLTVEASEAVQAAAMSKAVIQLINNMNFQVTGLNDHLPALDRMWETEAEKISAARDAIRSGAIPSDVFDLVSMPVASSTWDALATLSRQVFTITKIPATPVFLTNNTTQLKVRTQP